MRFAQGEMAGLGDKPKVKKIQRLRKQFRFQGDYVSHEERCQGKTEPIVLRMQFASPEPLVVPRLARRVKVGVGPLSSAEMSLQHPDQVAAKRQVPIWPCEELMRLLKLIGVRRNFCCFFRTLAGRSRHPSSTHGLGLLRRQPTFRDPSRRRRPITADGFRCRGA